MNVVAEELDEGPSEGLGGLNVRPMSRVRERGMRWITPVQL